MDIGLGWTGLGWGHRIYTPPQTQLGFTGFTIFRRITGFTECRSVLQELPINKNAQECTGMHRNANETHRIPTMNAALLEES
jgi:hypothetical protein